VADALCYAVLLSLRLRQDQEILADGPTGQLGAALRTGSMWVFKSLLDMDRQATPILSWLQWAKDLPQHDSERVPPLRVRRMFH